MLQALQTQQPPLVISYLSESISTPSNPEDKKRIEQLEARIGVLEYAFTAMQREYTEAIRALQRQMQEMSGVDTEHSDN